MIHAIILDKNYSTTRLLTKEKPVLKSAPEDKLKALLFLPGGKDRQGEGGLRTEGLFKKSYDEKPLITVVTVVFNGEKHLEQTIKSVIEQSYENVEYIIIDGGSTDGTIDIIKKYEKQVDYWISEPDGGIYDAMNKGLSLSTGDYIAYMNADDYYFSQQVLQRIAKTVLEQNVDVVYGDLLIQNAKEERLERAHAIGMKYGLFPYSMNWIWVRMIFGHPTAFVCRDTFKKYGVFDQAFRIAADYDFFIRLMCANATFHYLSETIAVFREGGVSTSEIKLLEDENALALRKNSRLIAFLVLSIRKVLKTQ